MMEDKKAQRSAGECLGVDKKDSSTSAKYENLALFTHPLDD
jgi:hypothetical protein